VSGVSFPARQNIEASKAIARRNLLDPDRTLFAEQSEKAIARLHRLDPDRVIFAEQSAEAIAAGAFHNDVVAVANERVLFAHEQAFADKTGLVDAQERLVPGFEYVEVAAAEVPLADAIRSYLFNAQLVTPPGGDPTLILPSEARETASVWRWVERHLAGNGPIRRVEVVDVRQSMANGGGPACLRLRVVADPQAVDPRFLVDEARLDRIAEAVSEHWPAEIAIDQLQQPALIADIERARLALLDVLGLSELA
jgi:succinylarginine dihydrolase